MTHSSPAQLRIHLVGMPHLDPVRATEWCAFSQKIRKLCDLLSGLGHEVVYYGGAALEAEVAEHVVVVTDEDRQRWFGPETWTEKVFDRWSPDDDCWREMAVASIVAIGHRVEPTDIIGLTMGRVQQPISDAFPDMVRAEVGIGYEGPILNGTHWCVESEAWRHHLYGRYGINDGRWFDTVIPNWFEPDQLEYRAEKDDYILHLGRITERKGTAVVAEVAKHHRVILAGQGDPALVPGAEYVGVVTGDDKRKLLAGARALIAPTTYIEPFGGVAVEAMLSGTPVITTPWGAFSETVAPEVGWKCHTLGEILEAIDNADRLEPADIRSYAIDRFTPEAVAPQYDRWLNQLATLYNQGWYQ